MAFQLTDMFSMARAQELIRLLKPHITEATNASSGSFKGASISNGVVSFYDNDTNSGTPLATLNLPSEYFIDQASTSFAPNFTWSAQTYPGSTNPDLDGKAVLVLGVKAVDASNNETIAYSFLDVHALMNIYTAGDNTIDITGNAVSVNVSNDSDNAITTDSNGLLVKVATAAELTEMFNTTWAESTDTGTFNNG